MVSAIPRFPDKAAGGAIRKRRAGGEGVFQVFESTYDVGHAAPQTSVAPGFCVFR